MPTQTFFNLPEEKRNRILDVALEEFAAHPFSKASLSKIVARAGIAKGSMYQYFEDKLDLYRYLLEVAAQQKLTYIQGQGVKAQPGFFATIEQIIRAGLRFGLEHPKLSLVIANANDAGSEQALRELLVSGKKMYRDFMMDMVVRAQAQGELRSELNPALVVQILIAVLGEALAEYIFDRLQVTRQDYIENPELGKQLTEQDITEIIHDVTQVLRKGLEF